MVAAVPLAAGPGVAVRADSAKQVEPLNLAKQVAGVRIPDSSLAIAAAQLAWSASPRFLHGHCMRTFVFASMVYTKAGLQYDDELVFIGSLLHDLGLVPEFMSSGARFEIDGADAAETFLKHHNVAKDRIDIVWDAIALHTSGGAAARRRGPETAAVGLGAAMDVLGIGIQNIPADRLREVLEAYPRAGFKTSMIASFVDLCRRKPMAQVAQFTAEIGHEHIPGFACPSFTSVMKEALVPA
jgi:hypothetical protein